MIEIANLHSRARIAAVAALFLGMIPAISWASTVTDIQQFLVDKGCEPGAVDGQWGGGSRRAAARFADVTGVQIDQKTDLDQLAPELIEADCQTDISLAQPDFRPPYVTPTGVIELPVGIRQYDWIPAGLRGFEWTKASAPFFDLKSRMALFTDVDKDWLGCSPSRAEQALDGLNELEGMTTTYEQMSEGQFLNYVSEVLPVVFCTGSTAPLDTLVRLFDGWAEADAFVGFGIRERVRSEDRDPSTPKSEGFDQAVSDTLVIREMVTQFMVVWTVAKAELALNAEEIARIETWFGRIVADQAFSHSEMPLDCPSFDDLPNERALDHGQVMRWDQFEECINTGTSRAGVSALWAMISGDRDYARDAFNTYMMSLYMLRSDGSHILESVRENLAHYKGVYNVAWMVVVAEAFAREGIDLYGIEVEGRSLLSHMEYLAKSAVDEELRRQYSTAPKGEQRIEMKDLWHWLVLTRYGDSKAAQLIKREIAGTTDRDEVLKLFNVYETRSTTEVERAPLLPFTHMLVPPDFRDYLPVDTRATIEAALAGRPDRCPDMDWTSADETFAGPWKFRWTIINVNGPKREFQGTDVVELKDGKGQIVAFGAENPRKRFREKFEIAYGSKGLCIAGMSNLFEVDEVFPVRLEGTFDDGLVTGPWPGGDVFEVVLTRAN